MRDLWLARGRTATLVLALARSLTAVGAVLGTRGILVREMPRSFEGSHPASATIVLAEGIDPATLEQVRRIEGVAGAERRAMIRARVEATNGTWFPLALFVIDDFDSMAIQTVTRSEGAWPPAADELLLEHSSIGLLEAAVASELRILTASGGSTVVRVGGTVFDAGVAPSWQEQAAYAYVTPATLAHLGLRTNLDLLVVQVSEPANDTQHIEEVTQRLSQDLRERGAHVNEIRIPPPGQHPHQRLMNGLTLVLLLFGLLALVLSALFVATVVSGMLSRQVRQIGSMKAIGATPRRVGAMYAGMVVMIGLFATLLAILPATLAARALASFGAELSNVAVQSLAVPWYVYLTVAALGVVAPLLASALPLVGASRMTVREAISDGHLYRGPRSSKERARVGVLANMLGPSISLAVRHAVRRRRRLAISLLLLAIGGATFITGRNVSAACERELARRTAMPGYDIEVSLGQPRSIEEVLKIARSVPGVEHVEPVEMGAVTTSDASATAVSGTHKDGGHGARRLYGLLPETRFRPALLNGRWMQENESDAIVVAPGELKRLGGVIGGEVQLSLDGRPTTWRVVGVARGIGLGDQGGLYVSNSAFARILDRDGTTGGIRVAASEHSAQAQRSIARALDRALSNAGVFVASITTAERWDTILRNHVALVQGALSWLGIVFGCVGALILASAMGTSVAERTREFGVMQTLGATPARVVWIVIAEALFVGNLSWILAVALGFLVSFLVGDLVGSVVFGMPLDLTVDRTAILAWLAMALLSSAAAAALPAAAASRHSIRETLAEA